MSDRRYMKVLPDSTGRRLGLVHYYELPYNAATGTFAVDQQVKGDTSNITATITRVITVDAATGTLLLRMTDADQDADKAFTDAEDLTVGGVFVAKANGVGFSTYNQTTNVVGGDNPNHKLAIDNFGAASTTFPEAPVVFSSFGSAKVTEGSLLKSYDFTYDTLPNEFTTTSSTGASETFVSASHASLLSCPTTSGALVRKFSDLYHKVPQGGSNLFIMGVLIGDTGKANVTRRWGAYDSEDGVFFQLSGSSMSVVARSNTTGTVIDTVVSQSSWNGDVLDGSRSTSNKSQISLDVSKTNIYWMDYKHIGGGSVRFGTWIGVKRVIVHEMLFNNVSSDAFMSKASLPIRVEQENIDTSVSTSELRFYGGSVSSDAGQFNPDHFALPFSIGTEDKLVTNEITSMMTIKPSTTHKGFANRKVSLLKTLTVSAVDNADGVTDARVRVIFYAQPILSGSDFAAQPLPLTLSSMLADTTASYDASFLAIESNFRQGILTVKGSSTLDISPFTSYQGSNLKLKGDGTTIPFNIGVQTTKPGVTASVDVTLGWTEVSD